MDFGLVAHARANPQRTALALGAMRRSYADLNARVNRLANGLAAHGIAYGDKIALLLANGFEFFEVSNAAAKLGAIATPINYHFRSAEIQYIADNSDAKAFVFAAEYVRPDMLGPVLPRLAKVRLQLCVGASSPPPAVAYETFLNRHPDTEPVTEFGAGGASTMIYTSGTTGRPKGVYRRPADRNQAAQLMQTFTSLFKFAPGDVHLLTGPLYHAASNAFSNIHIVLGGTVVIMPRFDAEEALRLIEREHVTTTHMVPTMFVRILKLPEEARRRYDLSSLKSVVHAAAPCPVEVKWKVMELFGPDTVHEYYAATEAGGTYISPAEWRRKPGSVGRPLPNAEVKVLDDDGNECPPGVIGTIYMRLNPQSEFEYYKDPEKTRANRRGNFATVGDMGYFDDDGYLFIADRKTDMVISGGVNIYPREIEDVLITHPKILDVAVLGVPDPEWGEQLKAVVQLKPGESATEGEIIAFARERLADYKRPRSVDFVAELPREPSGKLYKRKLKEKYWAGREKMV
jgi:long-chain acyl-CoA synthetase